jgi:peptidoglycan/LPS O-acetylase OafA/YrhL
MRYRPEVDGLRAVAVCSVILFHAGVPAFGGGYLGVDIFFVISGYLITGILVRELIDGRLSVWDFYDRRIRRIIPALLVVMIVSTVAAYCLMLPDDLENFGQSLVATSLFANNILLLLTSGYFALEASFKPLMHTWSLAVEEQYYLVVPLMLWAAFRLGAMKALLWMVCGVVLASFAFSVWASKAMPVANFLLLPFRAWELGIGAAAVLIQARLQSWRGPTTQFGFVLAFAGLAMIAAPMVLFGIRPPHPSFVTLVPVLGTALVLIFAQDKAGPGRLLAAKPVVALGLVSYSAYLYHQPVFAFARITRLEEPSWEVMLAYVPLIFLLAWASWRFVEQPFRNRSKIRFHSVAWLLGPASVAVIAIGLAMHLTSGFFASWPELANNDATFGAKQNIAYNLRPLAYLDRRFDAHSASPKLLVLGDSHARDFINMALEAGHIDGVKLSYSNFRACDFATSTPSLQENISRADFIVLGSGYSKCSARGLAQLRELSQAGLIVIGIKNFGWNNNAVMLLPATERYSFHAKPLARIVAQNALGSRMIDPATYVDILAMISDADGRVPVFTPTGKFISEDRTHLTKAGAIYIGAIIFQHPALSEISKAARKDASH